MNNITQYSDGELSLHFMNDEFLYTAAKNASDTSELREIAECTFIFTENQWLELEADFNNGVLD